jgi:hypothetical protein
MRLLHIFLTVRNCGIIFASVPGPTFLGLGVGKTMDGGRGDLLAGLTLTRLWELDLVFTAVNTNFLQVDFLRTFSIWGASMK